MFGTEIIEVGIGLAFAYFAISIICSGIVELGVNITKLRAKHLKMALGELLDDKHYTGFIKQLYDHHLISSPLKNKLGDPTSINAKNFATAVIEILSKDEQGNNSNQYKLIEDRINQITDPKVRERLLGMLKSSQGQFDTLRASIENWFNESMDAVSEWYRQRMRYWVTAVSLVVVGVMNADTLKMTAMFWNDDELRAATAEAARAYVNDYDSVAVASTNQPRNDSDVVQNIKNNLNTVYSSINSTKVLPIGWPSEVLPCDAGFDKTKDPIMWWLIKVAGLILTVGAVSLGSTYWYKQLKSLLSLRFGAKGQDPPAGVTTATPQPSPPSPTPPLTPVDESTPPADDSGGNNNNNNSGGGSQ
jgi:hypothetical protein